MAIIEKKYKVDLQDIGISNQITNHGVLNLLESIACFHSDLVDGYSINQMQKTGFSWMLLHWKVRIIKRVCYGTTVTVKTWASYANHFFTIRDFEIVDETGATICIASSKWTLINIKNTSIQKITDDVLAPYEPEDKSVFHEQAIPKLKLPILDNVSPSYTFTVLRRDIDVNKHMHNISYLDYAVEALPESIYNLGESNEFEIMYKTGAKLGSTIACYYTCVNNEHFVVMKNEDATQLHAIVKLLF